MTFIERLDQLCKEHGIAKRTLEKEAGLSNGATSKWNAKNGKTPGGISQQKIADYFGVSIDYLMGRSEFKTEKDAMIQRWSETYDEEGLSKDVQKLEAGIMIPVLGTVVAGVPLEAIEDVLGYEEIPEKWSRSGKHFALRIKGDSMAPRIVAGDVIICKQTSDVESGDLAVVLVNGDEATCKKVIKHPDGITLQPLNPSYEPMFFNHGDIDQKPVEIIGKVVELRGKY